jgi:cysteine-rich repeat protein
MSRTPIALCSPLASIEPIGVERSKRRVSRRGRGAGSPGRRLRSWRSGRLWESITAVTMRSLLCLLAATFTLSLSCKGDDPPPPPPDPECGNGLLEMGETCEGIPTPLGCDPNACTVRPGWVCTPEAPDTDGETGGGAVVEPMEWSSTCEEEEPEPTNNCGDGVVESPQEQCDDGNMVVMDGCSGCMVDPFYVCMGEPSDCYTCGDGFRNPGEECDDGELVPNQNYDSPGCTNCMVVPGWECFPSVMVVDLCAPVCGDGMWFSDDVVNIGFAEQCDDGNVMDGDGCDGNCNIEDGWECDAEAPETSVCTMIDDTTGGSSDSGDSSSDSGGSSSDSGGTTTTT